MRADSDAVALIPAFREERFIGDVVRRALPFVSQVVVVDDGSPDRTAVMAEEAGAMVLRHSANAGKGAALQTGFRWVMGQGIERVICLDGDGQHAPEEMPRFLEGTEEALIIGNRMADTSEMPRVRYWTNRIMSGMISGVCGQSVPDTQCGYRLLHAELLPAMFLKSSAFDYETEMLFAAALLGKKIGNVPVSTIYGEETSKIRPVRDALKFFKLLRHYRGEFRRRRHAGNLNI